MLNALMGRVKGQLGELESITVLTLAVCAIPSRFPLMRAWLRARPRWVPEKDLKGGKVMLNFTEW